MEQVNLEVVQGDTLTFEVEYQNTNGSPVNLAGYTAKMDVRDKPNGKILCASVTSTSGIVINNSNGTLNITFTPSQTKKFTLPVASYQLQIRSSSNVYTTILQGTIKVTAAVVR